MTRSVNQIQYVFIAIHYVFHLNSMAFNRDTTLFLKIHIIKHLPFSNLNGIGILQESVGNC